MFIVVVDLVVSLCPIQKQKIENRKPSEWPVSGRVQRRIICHHILLDIRVKKLHFSIGLDLGFSGKKRNQTSKSRSIFLSIDLRLKL